MFLVGEIMNRRFAVAFAPPSRKLVIRVTSKLALARSAARASLVPPLFFEGVAEGTTR